MSVGIGDRVRLRGVFTLDDEAADPSTVAVRVRQPSGTETSKTYGVDGGLIREAEGIYYYDLTLTQAGALRYRWVGTGSVVVAEERTIHVAPSGFSSP